MQGITYLPQAFSPQERPDRPPGLTWTHVLIAAVVLASPLSFYLFLHSSAIHTALWHEHVLHSLVEGLCAFVSLMLFYLLQQQFILSGNQRLRLMSFGFLAMGLMDLFHASAHPGSNIFVWFHSLSALLGSSLLLVSVFVANPARQDMPIAARGAWLNSAYFASGFLLVALVSHVAEIWLPPMHFDQGFSLFARAINALAGGLFLAIGIALLREFRWKREPILFVFSTGFMLFAESQAMFPMSELWDVSWWCWHGIKFAVFMSFLFVLALAYTETSSELALSRHQALDAFQRLTAAQASLVEAEKLATLGQMAAGLAHEIRNPLGAISNCLGMLKDRPLAEAERQEILAIVENEADHIAKIVRDTLTLGRANRRQLATIDLRALLEQELRNLPFELKAGVEITVTEEAGPPEVIGDGAQLQEVLWNLAMNALQALNGQGTLHFRLRREGNSVMLAVDDTGAGIPAQAQGRLFEPFFSTRKNGTGLGLPIVRRIVTDHGGSIQIASQEDRGTCAKVTLPAAYPVDPPSSADVAVRAA